MKRPLSIDGSFGAIRTGSNPVVTDLLLFFAVFTMKFTPKTLLHSTTLLLQPSYSYKLILTCQCCVQEIFQLHRDLDVGARGAQCPRHPLCLLQLLVQLIPQRLDRLPVIDAHFILQKKNNSNFKLINQFLIIRRRQ